MKYIIENLKQDHTYIFMCCILILFVAFSALHATEPTKQDNYFALIKMLNQTKCHKTTQDRKRIQLLQGCFNEIFIENPEIAKWSNQIIKEHGEQYPEQFPFAQFGVVSHMWTVMTQKNITQHPLIWFYWLNKVIEARIHTKFPFSEQVKNSIDDEICMLQTVFERDIRTKSIEWSCPKVASVPGRSFDEFALGLDETHKEKLQKIIEKHRIIYFKITDDIIL